MRRFWNFAFILPLSITILFSTSSEARRRKKKYGPVPFVEKGIGGIEFGDEDSSLKIIGQKRLEEIWKNNEGKILDAGIGLHGLKEGEVIILKPHSTDEKYAFSEVIITTTNETKDQPPIMAEPITVAALTDHEVRIDSPKEQIQKTFGKPSSSKKEKNVEVLTYRIKPAQDKTHVIEENERSGYFHEFTFRDGKVVKLRFGFED